MAGFISLLFSPMILAAAAPAPATLVQPPPSGAQAQGSLVGLFRPDDYPASAAERGAQGSVMVSLAIGADGLVQACTVARSSGHADLDQATCDVLRERARYRPARDARGRPVGDNQSATISWQMETGATSRNGYSFTPFHIMLSLTRLADGQQSCWLEVDGRRAFERTGAACASFGPSGPNNAAGEYRVVIAFAPTGAPEPHREAQVGEILGEKEAEIEVRPDGTIGSCRVLRQVGQATASDYCQYLRASPNRFNSAEIGSVRSGRMRTTFYARAAR